MTYGKCDLHLYINTPNIYNYTLLLSSTNYTKENYK